MFLDGGKGAESSGWSDVTPYFVSCDARVSCSSTGPAQTGFGSTLMQLHSVLKSASFDQNCYDLSKVSGEFNIQFLDCLLPTLSPS